MVDSVTTSVDVCDLVEVTARLDTAVRVRGVQLVETKANTAYKAACAFVETFCTRGVDVTVEKGIPFGAGLGGSSADAAAVVYCMCKLFGVDVGSSAVTELCARIGSDVNFMLFGGLGRLTGKGDEVQFATLASPLYFALTTFDVSMSSGTVYAAFDDLPCKQQFVDNDTLLQLLATGDNATALRHFGNCLQSATCSISSYADRYLAFVQSLNLHSNMTGSGSAYYVACETLAEAERVAKLLNAHGFATTVCKSTSTGITEIV